LRENVFELPIIFDEKDHPSLSTVYSLNDINDGIARQRPELILRRDKNNVSSLGNQDRVWIVPGPTASITNV